MAAPLSKEMVNLKMADDKSPVGSPTSPDTDLCAYDEGSPTQGEGGNFDFAYNHVGLTSAEADRLLAQWGPNELAEKVVPKWYIFASQLWQPMPCMIWIAAIIEAGIQAFPDMGILLFILFANAGISYYETTKAGDAIAALKASLKPLATVRRDGSWQTIDAKLVVPGDLVLLASGSAIPADCRCNGGSDGLAEIEIDQSALTGESLPITARKGDACLMGSTVVRGETEGTVEFTGSNSFFGKTAVLLGGSEQTSNLQKVLIRIMLVLVVMSLSLCVISFIYTLVEGEKDLSVAKRVPDALSFTVVILVASIPLAIEIVTMTTLALGSKELTAEGAIVARLAAIEDMAGMAILCSDKTGTLTLNKMVIQDHTPVYSPGETQSSILRYAAMATKWKEPPRDALDTLVLTTADLTTLDTITQTAYAPFDAKIKRTEGTVIDTTTGEHFKVTKGAPHILAKLLSGKGAGRTKVTVDKDVAALALKGIRSLAVAKTNAEGEWHMLGLLTFLDPPRPDTQATIDAARTFGVAVKMITGDHLLIAKETARVLNMGTHVYGSDRLPMLHPETKKKPENLARDYGDMCLAADGFAGVFPEHKYLIVECLRELGYKTGMTGDGVNDAPALKIADVGIAVSGATDAARAAADIVLTKEGLSTIVQGIAVSRKIFVRLSNFVTYRISATLQLLWFFFIAVFAFEPVEYSDRYASDPAFQKLNEHWPEFFHMPVLLLMLITLLNDAALIAIGYDNVKPQKGPAKWNLYALFFQGFVLGGVACLSSLFLLWVLLDSWDHSGIFYHMFGYGLNYGQITACIYLKVAVSDFLTLFSARGGDGWFWSIKPSLILCIAASFALTISTIVACVWPDSKPDGIPTLGLGRARPYPLAVYIWIYCLVWFIIQDVAKILSWKMMRRLNLFGCNNSGMMVLTNSAKDFRDNLLEASASIGHDAHGDHSENKFLWGAGPSAQRMATDPFTWARTWHSFGTRTASDLGLPSSWKKTFSPPDSRL